MDYVYKAFHFIFIILEVLLIFNLLIIVHEIGHFLAAKWRGLYVDGFGIWFGKPIWQKKINGVTYSLGSIPAGGFVKLPQMAPMEAMEGQTEVKIDELPPISPLDKIIVAFAGPLFSFGLAVVFATIVWGVGRPVGESETTQTVGYVVPDLAADKVGMKAGDKILEVDGKKVGRWGGMGSDSITWRIVRSEGKEVDVKVRHADGTEQTFHPEPPPPKRAHWWNRSGLRQIGIEPSYTAVISKIVKDSPADRAKLKENDRILKIDGAPLYNATGIFTYMSAHPAQSYELTIERDNAQQKITIIPDGVKVEKVFNLANSPAIQAGFKSGDIVLGVKDQNLTPVSVAISDYVEKNGGKEVPFRVMRDGKEIIVPTTPQIPENSQEEDPKPMIGLQWSEGGGLGMAFDPMGVPSVKPPNPVEQIRSSMAMILNTFDAVVSPKSSIGFQHMGGPVMMMRAYYMMFEAKDGWKLALWFSVILNVNLALLNLLPIPVLDGGHITLAIIEAIRRRPVNLKLLEIIQSACAIVIIGFMLFIVFYDVQDLPFISDKTPPISFKAPSAIK